MSYNTMNSWKLFQWFVYYSEKLIVQICDRMVEDGYRDAGYTYIALDDCWAEEKRDPLTRKLVPDRMRFPRGMKALADYVGLCDSSDSLHYFYVYTSQVLLVVISKYSCIISQPISFI